MLICSVILSSLLILISVLLYHKGHHQILLRITILLWHELNCVA
uniref:Uncharacterized protein n=1 Tax=Arundo donax TaxID=35708 RepID=A0A0A9FBY6_ARUDO